MKTEDAKQTKKANAIENLFNSKEIQEKAKKINVDLLAEKAATKKSLYKVDFLSTFGKEKSSNTTKRGQLRRKFYDLCKTANRQLIAKDKALESTLNDLYELSNKALIDIKVTPQFTSENKKDSNTILKNGFELMYNFKKI